MAKPILKNTAKSRLDEINEMISDLNSKMSWTPGWLKEEIRTLVKLEVEKASIMNHQRYPEIPPNHLFNRM